MKKNKQSLDDKTFKDFVRYAKSLDQPLNKKQKKAAKEIFNMPTRTGRTTLLHLLLNYDVIKEVNNG